MTPRQPCPRGPAAGAKSQDVYDTVMDLLRTQRVKPTDRVGEILKHEMVRMMSLGDTSKRGAIKKAIDQFTGGKLVFCIACNQHFMCNLHLTFVCCDVLRRATCGT